MQVRSHLPVANFADKACSRFRSHQFARSRDSRRRRRKKSRWKRYRHRLRRGTRAADRRRLVRLLHSFQHLEILRREEPELVQSPPYLYSIGLNARSADELGFCLYQELRQIFPRLDGFDSLIRENGLAFETSYRSVDIFSARTGQTWLIPSPLSLADIDGDLDLVNRGI